MDIGNQLNKKFMQIKKPKSHSAKIHDNTDEHLILISPSILENRMRDFEVYSFARGGIGDEIALALTLLVAILTAEFKDFPPFTGASIRGAFITSFVFILAKIGLDTYKIWRNRKSRDKLLQDLYNNKENL